MTTRAGWVVAALVLASCSSSSSTGDDTIVSISLTTLSSAPTSTSSDDTSTPIVSTTVAASPSTTTTIAATTTVPTAADPSYLDIPVGTCDTITAGAIGYRNNTGSLATQYEQIGTSSQGRPIWAEHWGTDDGSQVLVLGQVHGDECAPAWFVQAIRERPPTTFGIWLVPTVNPDGLAAHTRRTATDIDPNRDGFRLETPEARAVMEATRRFQPLLTIHAHSPYQWIGSHNGGIRY